MAVRSVNKVILVGNLTKDPDLRYTPNGTAVVTFTVATNREWTLESGEKREEAEFTRIVAWNKLAELCSQLLSKGRKVYVEGRLQTRSWTSQDGQQRTTTEVVISDMIILDSQRRPDQAMQNTAAVNNVSVQSKTIKEEVKPKKKEVKKEEKVKKEEVGPKPKSEEVNPDDIPF